MVKMILIMFMVLFFFKMLVNVVGVNLFYFVIEYRYIFNNLKK